MYFKNRAEAGRKLAENLVRHKDSNLSVVALSPGGAIVGAQVAMGLHGNLVLLMLESDPIPGEYESMPSMGPESSQSFENMVSPGELEEHTGEAHQLEDERRLKNYQKPHVLMGHGGQLHPEFLRHHTVVLVSDGLANGYAIDIANQFLKTISINRIIIATPIASLVAVDRMHSVADEICCLNIVENYIGTDHYYDDNTIPPAADLLRMTKNISVSWQQ